MPKLKYFICDISADFQTLCSRAKEQHIVLESHKWMIGWLAQVGTEQIFIKLTRLLSGMTNGFGITIDDQLDQAMNEESHFLKRLTELAS